MSKKKRAVDSLLSDICCTFAIDLNLVMQVMNDCLFFRFRRWLLCLVVVGLPIAAVAQTNWGKLFSSAMKTGQALTITDEELAEMVKAGVEQMDRQNQVCPSRNPYTIRLLRLTKNMKEAEGIPLNFKVYKTRDVNAFACPDGSVRVFSALMDELTDDELLGVLGHEIGHVALRHSKKAWKDAILRSAVSDAVGAFSSTWANLSDSFLGDVCSVAISAKHSRYQETQADDYGYEFLRDCGISPWAMGKAFIKLQKLSEGKKASRFTKWLQVFSSHPDFDTRIQRMRERAEEDGYPTD